MKTFGVLKKEVLAWAEPKKLLTPKNKMAQGLKTLEEVNEMLDAINNRNKKELIDAIGDVLVTLIIQCKKNELEPEECLQHALGVIKNRTGKTINGKFYKD